MVLTEGGEETRKPLVVVPPPPKRSSKAQIMNPSRSKLSYEDRIEALREFTKVVASGATQGVVIFGSGGTGKTHEVLEALAEMGLKKDKDYKHQKGYSAPAALYNYLYEHRDKTLVLDDMDSVFRDPIAWNLMKAILDSYEKRPVSWHSTTSVITAPAEFDFEGRVIFITNLPMNQIKRFMGALLTRVLSVDMDASRDELLQRMKYIASKSEYKGVDREKRLEIARFIKDNNKGVSSISLRTYFQVCDFYQFNPKTWRRNARRLLLMS